MSYNGSGTFNINTAGQPVVTGTVISSTAFNALTADLGTGLSTAITKDGQTVATARIPFAAGINSSLVTDATSTTTGSIITAGGVGIAKALFVGTTANIAGTTTLAGVTATSITDSGLTSGRVTFASTSGLLADAAALAWDGTSLSATKFAGALNGTVGATTPAAGAFTTLSATGVSSFGAGAVGAPSIYLSTDTTTGFYRIGANNVGFAVSGAKLLDMSSSGLTVRVASNNTLVVDSSNVAVNGTLAAGATTVTGTLSATGFVGIGVAASVSNALEVAGDIRLQGGNNSYKFNNGLVEFKLSQDAGATAAASLNANLTVTGSLSKGSGSFRISHPLPTLNETHNLVHSFIEGPQADLIYRGQVALVAGKATVNIDTAATMTEGTFEVLCRNVQCFTSNESGWGAIRGKVIGNILTIEAQDSVSTDNVSWMVIGERKDPHIMETEWTDDDGKVIVEPLNH